MLAFVATFLALPFAIHAILLGLRRARCRSAAASLGARHVVRGWLAPGQIVGERFTIEPVKIVKSFRTRVELSAGQMPGTVFLRPEFFADPPRWEAASVPGESTHRVFLWQLSVAGRVLVPSAQQMEWLAWLDRGVLDARFGAALASEKVGELVIADGRVSALLPGIVLDAERLRRVLDLLERVPREAWSDAPARPARVAALSARARSGPAQG